MIEPKPGGRPGGCSPGSKAGVMDGKSGLIAPQVLEGAVGP